MGNVKIIKGGYKDNYFDWLRETQESRFKFDIKWKQVFKLPKYTSSVAFKYKPVVFSFSKYP